MKALTGCLDVWDQTNSFLFSLILDICVCDQTNKYFFHGFWGGKCHSSQGFCLPNKLFTFIFSGTSVLA